jgi:hypothetical protein
MSLRAIVIPLLTLGVLSMLAVPAESHHSFSAFDDTQVVELSGTVRDWQWTNPHVWLNLDVIATDGSEVLWGIEGQSPEVLRRQESMPRDVVKVGDKVTISIHPRRDGTRGGSLMHVLSVNGHDPAKLS